jgi:uncharacterized protein
MAIRTNPSYRAAAVGVATAALLVGAFSLGVSRGAQSQATQPKLASAQDPDTRITVTGNGTVTGTPNQLLLSMGVQVNGASVSSALIQANQAVRRVTGALRADGVAAADIQTAGLAISPNYQGNSQVPVSYGVSESLSATLDQLGRAGSQIQAAVNAGGNAVTVNDVSLNLTDTGKLLAAARARAVQDAKAKAAQFAKALKEPLGPVISITPTQSSQVIFGVNAPLAYNSATVPISPGKQQVSVSITVVYAA